MGTLGNEFEFIDEGIASIDVHTGVAIAQRCAASSSRFLGIIIEGHVNNPGQGTCLRGVQFTKKHHRRQ